MQDGVPPPETKTKAAKKWKHQIPGTVENLHNNERCGIRGTLAKWITTQKAKVVAVEDREPMLRHQYKVLLQARKDRGRAKLVRDE